MDTLPDRLLSVEERVAGVLTDRKEYSAAISVYDQILEASSDPVQLNRIEKLRSSGKRRRTSETTQSKPCAGHFTGICPGRDRSSQVDGRSVTVKKSLIVALVALSVIVGSIWRLHAQRTDTRQPASLLPSGAIFYLEAKDFHKILTQWNSSEERRRWLKSDNATVLSQSRLLQRLMQAQHLYAAVAGVPVEMNLVDELAGDQSAFAFYEFSTVQFVYLTHLDNTRLDQSGLWKSRSTYQAREASGIPFYVKTQTEGRETYTVAFASHDSWLVVATEPTLMAQTLALLAGQANGPLSSESWYEDAVSHMPQQGDLRLVYNFTALRQSPQFRTYWLQNNATELAGFTAGGADLFEQRDGFEERRVMIKPVSSETTVDNSGLSRVLTHISPDATLYRAWSTPSRSIVRATLSQVVLSESPSTANDNKLAPEVTSQASVVGSESDLETRIDEPNFQKADANDIDILTDAVMAMEPKGLLHSQVTQITGDHVFVVPESEAVFAFAKPDRPAIDKALESSISLVHVGSLDPLEVSDGNGVVVLSRLHSQKARRTSTTVPGEVYSAGYEHASEWPHYKRLFGVIDHKTGDTPMLFSNNLRSLGDSLYRLRRVSMTTQQEGVVTRDTVRYELASK